MSISQLRCPFNLIKRNSCQSRRWLFMCYSSCCLAENTQLDKSAHEYSSRNAPSNNQRLPGNMHILRRAEVVIALQYHTQLTKMPFDENCDLTADGSFWFLQLNT